MIFECVSNLHFLHVYTGYTSSYHMYSLIIHFYCNINILSKNTLLVISKNCYL